MTAAIVVAGTDTDVGKTVFCAALTSALDGYYWKPIQAGRSPETDSQVVRRLGDIPDARILPERYVFDLAASPHLAAERENITIDVASLSLPSRDSTVVVELAGGLMVPLTRDTLQIELLTRWKAPVILCARTALGTINHSLLSIAALKQRAIPILGVAFVGEQNPDSENTIASFGGVRRLGRLPLVDSLDAQSLMQTFADNFDVAELLGIGGAGP